MKGIALISGFISVLITSGVILPASSQVTSDNTTNTTVTSSGNNFNILNGIQKGNNLFHSFKEFSIPTGGSATFQNSSAIENIINRVTGGNISNIDGLIKASGNANLFLINPSGIVFGENAKLDIGGSFIGSTAESLLFEDGFNYSAVNSQSEPLLTVSVPEGLQMGKNPGAIEVKGSGHSLTTSNPYFSPYLPISSITGLEVKPGKTLALIGGDINLNSGILNAPGGIIELGSVDENTLVNLNNQNGKFTVDYPNISNFGNIKFSQKSLLNVSGTSTSSIQLQAKNISLNDGSFIWSRNLGIQPGGDIKIIATELLELNGTSPSELIPSGILSETLGLGASSNIDISTSKLILQNGGAISNRTYTPAPSGNLTINAIDFIQMEGTSPKTGLTNVLTTATLFSTELEKPIQTSKAGDLSISTPYLLITDGSYISSLSIGDSSAGNIRIDTDKIEITGGAFNSYYDYLSTAISGVGYLRGNSGSVTLNTDTLNIKDGAMITTTNLGRGDAGDVNVNATESIKVEGFFPVAENEIFSSNISSTVGSPSILIQQTPGYEALGNSGNVTVNTPMLEVSDKANISVSNYGAFGSAGILKISSDSIQLNRGIISALAISGEGGNIDLNLNKSFIARNNSLVNIESLGTGNGGNLTLNSPVIAGFENSDIIANAVEGNGGNIDITTSGIFGLKSRDELTLESDISASSEFGINGNVEINNINIDPSSGLVELSTELTDSSQKIAQGCSSNSNNSFVITGRGGILKNPSQYITANLTWSDIRDLSTLSNNQNTDEILGMSNKTLIVEATGFIRNKNGVIELVASENKPFTTGEVPDCSGKNT